MHTFATPLESGIDASTNLPVFGFTIRETFICYPFLSECGRFIVDPVTHYGISEADAKALDALNELVERTTEATIETGCRSVQKALGIAEGDLAGTHFSADVNVHPIAQSIVDYILVEYRNSQSKAQQAHSNVLPAPARPKPRM